MVVVEAGAGGGAEAEEGDWSRDSEGMLMTSAMEENGVSDKALEIELGMMKGMEKRVKIG